MRKDIPSHCEVWGYSRALTEDERARMREGYRFIHGCYYVLIGFVILSASMSAYLTFFS